MQPTSSPSSPLRRVDVRGLTFDVYDSGPDDGEPALLLHGFPQHSAEWDIVLPALHAAGLRTYALNQRGYSAGARPEGAEAYRMTECVADAVAVLDALNIADAHVIGHDWGAVVAWYLAAWHADRVRTLTAVSVPHPAAMAHALTTDPDQRERSAYIGLLRQAGEAEDALLRDDAAFLRRVLTGVGDERRVNAYAEPMLLPGALTAALNWYRAMSDDALVGLPAAGSITVPTTYVWSDEDVAIGRTAAESCAEHVTGDYRFVALRGVTHWIPDEAPAALGEAVLARVGSL